MANEEFIVTSRSKQGVSPTRRIAFRMAESFFRRWPLYVLPVLLLVGVGVALARKTVAKYQSTGVISVVSNPLLGDLSSIQVSGGNNFQTPAGRTAQTMNELLGTDGFIQDVANRAGFKGALASGAVTIADLRAHVYATANGYQLLQVVASWPTALGSEQIAKATIDGYTSYALQSQVAKTKDASTFWAARAAAYQTKVSQAQRALQDFVKANPPPAVGTRNESKQIQITTLTAAIDQAQTQETNAQTQKESADLTTQELSTAAGQGLQVVDAPKVAGAPESARRKQILTVAIFFVLGLLLAGSMLSLSTLLDRSVRSAEDILGATGLVVIATVPSIAVLRKRRAGQTKRRSSRKEALTV